MFVKYCPILNALFYFIVLKHNKTTYKDLELLEFIFKKIKDFRITRLISPFFGIQFGSGPLAIIQCLLTAYYFRFQPENDASFNLN